MKKAFIEQLFLGFLLLMGIVTFVATVNDETSTRNRIYDLKALAKTSSQAIARHYEQQLDMCSGQDINGDILTQSKLGQMVIDDNLLNYSWEDTSGDGQPDQITTTIAAHEHESFWYRFFDKDSFNIGPFIESEKITTARDVNINYGGTNAGFTNMIGTYQLDANNCVTNAQLILADAQDPAMVGQQLGSQITSPPTFIFLMSDGYRDFVNNGYTPGNNDSVNMSQHCFGNTIQPDISITGNTPSNTNIYFEHTDLNVDDGFEHIQIIPSNIWDYYNDYVNGTGQFAGQGTSTYDDFKAFADGLNNDNDPSNDVDYENDPNDEYQYAMEDLDRGGDEDFNDIFLDSTRVAVPNLLNDFTVENDGLITLECDTNQNPILTIGGCPVNLNEDASTSTITWTATDPDGTIANTTGSALNGSVSVNNNGTITYTPLNNYYGSDTITIQTEDDMGAVGFGYCTVNVNEINDIPIITGTPSSSVTADSFYSFIPTASDADSDVLTFSITNQPSWLSFNTTTGQISGTPSESDVAIYSNIIITADDSRGGTASLTAFAIEVLTNNGAPIIVSPIPDQSTAEGNTYTYDASIHFSDPNSDPLIYTISGGGNINSSTGIINYVIPDGTAGNTIPLTITASDGTNSVSDSFVLTITSNSDCNGPFESKFSNNSTDGWSGGLISSNNLKLNGQTYSYKSFNFGQGCAEKDITLEFEFKTNSNWENSDKFELYSNDTHNAFKTYDKTNSNWLSETITVQTDIDGWVTLFFYANSSKTNERARVDNIVLTRE